MYPSATDDGVAEAPVQPVVALVSFVESETMTASLVATACYRGQMFLFAGCKQKLK